MWLETIHKPSCDEEKCPTCAGGVRKWLFGEMYAGSFIQNGERVGISRKPNKGFSNPIVLDPITQYFDGGLYRLWPSDKYLSRGGKKLHRDVWRSAFGVIPDGCHIHHKDSNPKNNQLHNLECIPAKIHLSETWHANPKKGFNQSARDSATAWHQSDEGRLWHKRHAARQQFWTKNKREEKPCLQCNVLFMALVRKSASMQKYCTEACKVKAYRARGADKAATARYRERQKIKSD